MTTETKPCALCGAPATRTIALSLALAYNYPICDDWWCEHRAGAVLVNRYGGATTPVAT